MLSGQAAYDLLAKNKPDPNAEGVVVYVGSAKQILMQVSAYSSDKTYTGMTPTTLLQEISTGQSTDTVKIGTAEKVSPIGKYEAAESSFTYSDTKTSTGIARGTLMIMQIAGDQFALLLSFATPDQAASVSSQARNMAATLVVSSTR